MADFLSEMKQVPFVLRHPDTLTYIEKMCRDFPAATFHREVFKELGCDFSYARKDRNTGCWFAVMELNKRMQQLLGNIPGIKITYTPFQDLQPRTIEQMRKQPVERQINEGIYLLHSPDIFAQKKIDTWTVRDPFSTLVLPATGEPREIAEGLLNRIVMASSQNNPYDITTPVSGSAFFGRDDTLRSLVGEIRSGHVCGIFGLRKTGKTSLLTELGRRFMMTDDKNHIYVLRDLEVLPTADVEKIPQLISDIANQLQIAFKQYGMRTHELAAIDRKSSMGDLRQAIEASLRRGVGKEKLVVLALDEIESLVGANAITTSTQTRVPEFFGALRALVQENRNFNVVLSGITTAPVMYPTIFGRENPLFAWAKPTFVAAISESESSKMIQVLGSRMAARWQQEALQKVHQLTGGQVFLTRSLAGYVASQLSTDIEDREIDEYMVETAFRQWRRTAVALVDGMTDTLGRFYPEELSILELGMETDNFDELEYEYPSGLANLISLGILVDNGAKLELSPWTQLGANFRKKQ